MDEKLKSIKSTEKIVKIKFNFICQSTVSFFKVCQKSLSSLSNIIQVSFISLMSY